MACYPLAGRHDVPPTLFAHALRYRILDFIHLTQEGHAMIAAALLPRVLEILDRRRGDAPPRRNASRPAPVR